MKQSRQELCNKYQRERRRLYNQRRKLIINQKAGKYKTKRDISSSEKKIKSLSKKIDSYQVKIFRCGKRWDALRKKRSSLKRKKRRLLKSIKSPDLSNKDKNRLLSDLSEVNDSLRDIYSLMGKKIIVERGEIKVIEDESRGFYSERVPVWILRQEANPSLNSGIFYFLDLKSDDVIDFVGDVYSLEINFAMALFALDEFITKVHEHRDRLQTQTPMVWLSLDESTKTITIST
jgi:hypothetical protein